MSCFSFPQQKHLDFAKKQTIYLKCIATLRIFFSQDYPKLASEVSLQFL